MNVLSTAIYAASTDGVLSSGTLVTNLYECLGILSPKYIGGGIEDFRIDYKAKNREIDVFSLEHGLGIILAFPYGMPEGSYQKTLDDLKACRNASSVEDIIERNVPPGFMYDRLNKASTPQESESISAGKAFIVWCRFNEETTHEKQEQE